MLLRTWRVSCPMFCYLCHRGLEGLVVLFFAICVLEDLEGSCLLLCYRCYRGLGGLVVLYFALCVMEDVEG
jgi:hypothetical protein